MTVAVRMLMAGNGNGVWGNIEIIAIIEYFIFVFVFVVVVVSCAECGKWKWGVSWGVFRQRSKWRPVLCRAHGPFMVSGFRATPGGIFSHRVSEKGERNSQMVMELLVTQSTINQSQNWSRDLHQTKMQMIV